MNIYIADIMDYTDYIDDALPLLPADRQERVRRAPTREKKLQNVCAGLLLRRLAGDAPILRGEHGKPRLEQGPHFSLSHGGQLAVLAVSDAPVGVDVERPRPVAESVARRYFLPEEQTWMAADPAERFFRLWTRKEAVLKCCGRGLSLSPASFSVLGEETAAEGMTCRLHTELWQGHILSVAAVGELRPRLVPLSPESLM